MSSFTYDACTQELFKYNICYLNDVPIYGDQFIGSLLIMMIIIIII